MIAYIDSSAVLRVILRQPNPLAEWKKIVTAVSSVLLEVECLRTIDRLRLLGDLDIEQATAAREAVYRVIERVEMIELTPAILRRASQPMPTPLGTLDAMHVASLELWREVNQKQPDVATHDKQFGTAARSLGYRVLGL